MQALRDLRIHNTPEAVSKRRYDYKHSEEFDPKMAECVLEFAELDREQTKTVLEVLDRFERMLKTFSRSAIFVYKHSFKEFGNFVPGSFFNA